MSTYLTILQTNKIFVSGDQNIGKTKVSSVYLIQIYSLTSARCIFLNFQPMVNGFAIMRSVVSVKTTTCMYTCIKLAPMQHISLISKSAHTLRCGNLMTWYVKVNSFYMCIRAIFSRNLKLVVARLTSFVGDGDKDHELRW